MADKDDKNTSDTPSPGTPGFDPKPVQLGGESIIDRIMPYRKKIGIAILLGFAVWAAIAVVFYFRNSKREKNTTRIAKVLEVSQRAVRPAGQEPDPKAPEPTFASNKERAEAVLAEIQKADAKLSPTYRGSLLMQAGRIDEAIAAYRSAQGGKSIENVLAREGLGLALEVKAAQTQDAAARQKVFEEALAVFQSMQPDEKGPRRAYAHYHQARILLDHMRKTDEAKTQFEKAKELAGAGSPLTSLIEERLASLGA